MDDQTVYIRWFDSLSSKETSRVGGKNASLGEMISKLKEKGIRVPDGFATTAKAYRIFLKANNLEREIRATLDAFHQDRLSLQNAGQTIRELISGGSFPEDVSEAIRLAYRDLSARYDTDEVDVAVRSSATAEDLPEASFAGQLETYLNVSGEKNLLAACKRCFASLFTDRAIAYREEHGFDHMEVALSVGVQKMVRSDKAGAGVLFTIDTESGFPNVVIINAAWGLGENVVQGSVNPDQYTVFKPLLTDRTLQPIIDKKRGQKEQKMVYTDGREAPTTNVETTEDERLSFVLSDDEILRLARWAVAIEDHYERPMDIEWAKDGDTDAIFIVQARPETVQSRRKAGSMKTYRLKERGKRLLTGLSIGQAVAAGKVCVIMRADEMHRFEPGAVLVTDRTDPDWVPIMKQAAGIVTDHGGRTSHAAIVSRELGIPAVIGTGKATTTLEDDQEVTLSCVEGDEGYVYEGVLDYEEEEIRLEAIPETKTHIMMNIASPPAAMRWWRLPARGVGLARIEYVVGNVIKIHPLALTRYEMVEDQVARRQIKELTRGYDDRTIYFVDRLAWGIATIAASQYPDPVVVRTSDFKTNEYAGLIGGAAFEPKEENPMLGWRGASRYYSDDYRDGFALECRALKKVREEMGFTNVVILIPFCRTPEEADRVLEAMEDNGLRRGENDLKVFVMAEIPSNVVEADAFAKRFDGFSIGSNDLTQLVLGVDRDSDKLSYLFDERETSVKRMIRMLIETAHGAGRPVGICGQAPSDYPDFAAFLVEAGIDSISLNPDSVLSVIDHVAAAERTTTGATL